VSGSSLMWPLLAMIGLPVLTALLVATARDASAAARIAIAGSAATWVVVCVAAAGQLGDEPARAAAWGSGEGVLGVVFALELDALAAAILILATTVGLLVQVYSSSYLAGDPRYRSYAALVALFGAAMNAVVLAGDLVVLLIGWEVMGVCSYLLISHHWELPAARFTSLPVIAMAAASTMVRLATTPSTAEVIALAATTGSRRASR